MPDPNSPRVGQPVTYHDKGDHREDGIIYHIRHDGSVDVEMPNGAKKIGVKFGRPKWITDRHGRTFEAGARYCVPRGE